MKHHLVYWIISFVFWFPLKSIASDQGRFLSWAVDTIQKIEKEDQSAYKLKPIVKVTDLLDQKISIQSNIAKLHVEKELFYMEIFEVFEGI